MGDFLSQLFGGSNDVLHGGIGKLGDLGQFSSNVGQNATNTAQKYYSDILSGDPSKIAESIAPEIKANQDQAGQQKKTMAEFGTRSGGNTAAANNIDTQSRSNIINLISQLMSGAAGAEGNLGTSNLGMASGDIAHQAQLSQQEMQNHQNSIFGGILGGLGNVAGQAIQGGLGMIPGLGAVI